MVSKLIWNYLLKKNVFNYLFSNFKDDLFLNN